MPDQELLEIANQIDINKLVLAKNVEYCMVLQTQVIDSEYMTKLVKYLEANPNIIKLDLDNSSITDEAARALAEHFKKNNSLKTIDINDLRHQESQASFTEAEFLDLLGDFEDKILMNSGLDDLEDAIEITDEDEIRQFTGEILELDIARGFNDNKFTMPRVKSISEAMTILAQKIGTHRDVEILDFRNVVINEEAAKELLSIIKKNPAIKVYNFNPGGDLFAKFISYNLSKISSDIIQLGVEAVGGPTGINIKLDATSMAFV